MATITAHLTDTRAQNLASEPVEVYVETPANAEVTRHLLTSSTNGSGSLSLTLDKGVYQLRIPRTKDRLRFQVPSASGSFDISNLLL